MANFTLRKMKALILAALVTVISPCLVGAEGVEQYGFKDSKFIRATGYTFEFTHAQADKNHWRMGFFNFRWNGERPIRLWGFRFEKDGSFRVRFENFSKFTNGEWGEISVGYCGTGAKLFELKPSTNYVLKIPLWPYEKKGEKGVVKIDGEDISVISKPFDVAPLKQDALNRTKSNH